MTSEMVGSAWPNIDFFLYRLDPKGKNLVRRHERFRLKFIKKKQSAVFNQTCLDNDLLPKYIYIYIYILRGRESEKEEIETNEKYILVDFS